MEQNVRPMPTFKEALKFWTKLGFISFGGPAGQISIMHEYLVVQKKWISDSKFLHALNYCMILPGPEAQQLATYTGWMLHGTLGGLAAGLLFILPSLIILLILSLLYVAFGNLPLVYSVFSGLKPAIIAIVIFSLIKIGKKSLLSLFHYAIAASAFICIFFFNVPFPLIIIGAILVGWAGRRIFPTWFEASNTASHKAEHEDNYFINKKTIVPGSAFNPARFWKIIIFGALLWIIPLIAFYTFTDDFSFWKSLSLFFSQAALVTFGGAYSVLPYVAQMSVIKFQWLTELQMIDGLALGETTPGPLIIVLVFVGFMAGHNQYNSLGMGTLGLFTTAFYTFLPSFIFIFAGAPFIERTQENKHLKAILPLVTAAVVGVILNLVIMLGKAVIITQKPFLSGFAVDWVAVAWMLISLIALYRYKINMMYWIGISGLFGLIWYLILTSTTP